MPNHKHFHGRSVGEKWDDIKRDIKNIANELTHKSPDQAHIEIRAPSTVFKTVFKTMEPTFTGEIGGYVTMSSGAEGNPTVAVSPAATSDLSPFKAQGLSTGGAGGLPESLVPTSGGAFSDHTGLALETAPTTARNQASSTLDPAANNVASPSASSSASSDSSSEGSSAAVKAGIAIGVLGGLLIIGLAVFFLFGRRRKQMEKERAAAQAEKSSPPFGGAAVAAAAVPNRQSSVRSTHTTRTTATAPRLSLRPVTQFLPEFGERRSSKGAAMALALGPPPSNSQQASRPAGQSPWARPMTAQSNSHEDPFGDHAEHHDGAPRTATMEQPNNPFDAPEHVVGVAQTTDAPRHAPNGMASAAAAAAAAAGGAGLARKQSVRKDVPQPLDLTRVNDAPLPLPSLVSQPSPTGTEFSFTSVAPGQSPGPSQSANAIAAAGGPAHSTVHRVQLDFKPSLEDEMELKAGQLVRLLHEYDDGWALCIRLDRSQQGVVPRTCLSTRPVKPRPAGGPPGARNGPPVNPNRGPGGTPRGQRPMTPQGGRPQSPAMMSRPQSPAMRPQSPAMRPQSPAMSRPQSPALRSPAGMRGPQSPGGPMNGRPASPGPRPMSPAGARGQSPGPRQRNGSESDKSARRMTPPGPSPLQQQQQPPPRPIGRKPVPGQAY
ncbi:variant SH3 domain-containing protein [Apiospora rasikravindrae]|uniref:Variant SH3 domain-containing protein n=1 Tax=Apiospora rasikravindrae TaxID=990691 RepID=A0ABR1TYN1_9PEZI